ncbi:hypothetical protein BP6252_04214 [Coleophoma cylindrospora]|uniref:Zn(2)-C6 fungal-type domain-containing protein n=1 Tax=Coleophoma cylindrospora TaxID=1849047 RepID=A0A3D8RZW2_9HELO|nr:hypothetical protein BP6252_04214 [Coleophoma cylindrospora]
MVNTGKPSKGCYLCRARRIKCDEGKPSCMRCQKSKRVCPGYRDSFELNLRDETKSTKRKASKSLSIHETGLKDAMEQLSTSPGEAMVVFADPGTGSPAWASYIGDTSPDHLSYTYNTISGYSYNQHMPMSSPRELSTPVDQQAFSYFLSNFVLIPEQSLSRGFFDFLLPLLKAEQPGSPLSTAFSAVAMAAFGVRPNSRCLLPHADAFYVKALKQINTVLQHPKLALKDSTLAAVLLLGFYEARAILSEEAYWFFFLTSSQTLTSSQLTVKGWISHIEGAVALVKSRGKKQMETQIGRDLFMAIRSQMTMVGIANSKHVDCGVEWWMEMAPQDDVSRRINELNLRLADLRAEADCVISLCARTAANLEKVLKLLRDCEALEQQYSEWFDTLPSLWRAKTVAWVDSVPEAELPTANCHPGKIDLYSEIWMGSQVVTALSSRLFVWSTILRCTAWLCSPLDYRITPEYTTAARMCSQMIEDIVAAIPYFFGWNFETESVPSMSHFATGDDHKSTPKVLAGVFTLWPIFAAATNDFATESQRIWLRGRLQYIGESMGVNHANLLFQASQLRHPSMFIFRDSMNLPPSNCKVPLPVQQRSPTTSESSIVSPTYPEPMDEGSWHLKVREALMVQANHPLDMNSGENFADYIAV